MAVTFLTGASSGIGRSLARRLAADGDVLALVARRRDLLESLAREIESAGGRALAIPCDVTDRSAVQAAVRRAEAGLGPIECLVANAGGGEPTPVDPFEAAHVERVLALNVGGTANCIEAVLPGMLARGSGHIVATSSLAAYRGLPAAAAYSAAKAALTNLLESLMIDLRPKGIDVTLILPGFVRTKPRGSGAKRRRPKPLQMDLEDATRRMHRAIRARRSRYAFPLPMVLAVRLARLIPTPLYARLLAGKGPRPKPVGDGRTARRDDGPVLRSRPPPPDASMGILMAMTATTRIERLRLRRRRLVKRTGKRLFRRIDAWLGRQSLVPTDPVLDASLFPWAGELRRGWRVVRGELDALLRHRNELPNFQELSPDQYKISPDDLWKTFVFTGFGERSEQARRLCPETTRLLEGVPRLQTAFFSILAPGKHVPLHKGVTRGMVRCHLGLKIPAQAERCTMTVGGQRCTWKEGETLFFDDTYPHEVTNDTPEERVVLLFDFERPMTRRGRLVAQLLMVLLRRTAYFKDAQRNQQAWEKRFRERVPDAAARVDASA